MPAAYNAIIAMPAAKAAQTIPQIDHWGTKEAVLGATFASTLETPAAVAVHCSPQANPSGQQSPPLSAGQRYQLFGHDPPSGAGVATLAPDGATITTPFVSITVVE
jgi:hypothetical protein